MKKAKKTSKNKVLITPKIKPRLTRRSPGSKVAILTGANPMGRLDQRLENKAVRAGKRRVHLVCPVCDKKYSVSATQALFRAVCSRPCYDVSRNLGITGTITRKAFGYKRSPPSIRSALRIMEKLSDPTLSTAQVARLRGRVATILAKHIETAADVLEGKDSWSNQQVRVFTSLLDRVVPTLSASQVQHEHTHRNVHELSIEELELLIAENSGPTLTIPATEVKNAEHDISQPDPVLLSDLKVSDDGVLPAKPGPSVDADSRAPWE